MTLAASGLIAAVLVVGALVLAGLLRQELEHDTAVLLNQQIDDVVALANTGTLPTALQAKGREIGQLQVHDSSGTIIAATKGVAEQTRLDLIAAPTADGDAVSTVSGEQIDHHAGERYRVVARTVSTKIGRLRIFGVSSLRLADNAVRTMALALLAGIPIFAGVSAWVLWRSVGRALGPVDAMRAEVDEIEATSLERRLAVPTTGDELARLGHTLNHLLDRLHTDAQRQRQFAADASHELRSPLAAARTQLEVGLAYPTRTDWPETASDVLIEIDRLERLSRELLDFARYDSSQPPADLAPIDIVELVTRVVVTSPPGRLSLEWRPPPQAIFVSGDDDLLTRLLRNLLNNAQRHARTRMEVDVQRDAERVSIRVSNDGAPIDPEEHDRIFEPFTRLDAARAADAGGAGLGLAISRRIALTHGGDLVADAVIDGASFTLVLPAVPSR